MAEGTLAKPAYVDRLLNALQQGLPGSQIAHEHVRRDRYRFIVVWDGFDDMGHPERQRIVWDIAEAILDKSDLREVSMILTLGMSDVPDESDEEPAP